MKKKAAIVLPLSLILGASATTATSVDAQPGPPCTGTNHCVDITIAHGAIQFVPDVQVTGKNHQIYWLIKTGGYSFRPTPPDGITFKAASSANSNQLAKDEFRCNRVSATQFHCTDANTTHGAMRKYEYSITVFDTAGHSIVSDPWIVNK